MDRNETVNGNRVVVRTRLRVAFPAESFVAAWMIARDSRAWTAPIFFPLLFRSGRAYQKAPVWFLSNLASRDSAKHRNVDNVNERNWRFLFPSWRSSSCAPFCTIPSSSFDSIVRRNADWILDFTYEPLDAPSSVCRHFLGTRRWSRSTRVSKIHRQLIDVPSRCWPF